MMFFFRTDASLQIGSGHVMRCLALADELRCRGAKVNFICREHFCNLIGLIESKLHEVIRLPQQEAEYVSTPEDGAHASWLGVSWQQDAADTITALGEAKPYWLIVDHYAIDHRWEQALRPHVGQIMVIDDLADHPHDCDLLLNQNLGSVADTYKTMVTQRCTFLMGPRYALLRPEFAALREYSLNRRQKPHLEKILINMGGVDKDNITGKVLEALNDCDLPVNCKITVVMGLNAPWLNSVRYQAQKLPWDMEIKKNVSDMARIMAESDLAIGAAGSTSWERCCLGLPTIMLVIAANQEKTGRLLEQAGAAVLLNSDWFPPQLQHMFQTVFSSPQSFRQMIVSASNITDGQGTLTVLKYLMA